MKKLLSILAIVRIFSAFPAQNAVDNPGFEQRAAKPNANYLFMNDIFQMYGVRSWTQPTTGSSDYFFMQNGAMNINPYAGEQKAASGSAYAGFITWLPDREYREYLCGSIVSPLEKGKKYVFRMKISTGNLCPFFVKEIGVMFTAKPFLMKTTEKTVDSIPDAVIDISALRTAGTSWITVEQTFTADGTERYFTFGNFNNDKKTAVHIDKMKQQFLCPYAYYYADDIEIVPVGSKYYPAVNSIPESTPLASQIVAGNTFTARGILFDVDKATLRPESYLQLHAILAELKRKPELKVEISGHTDSTGTAAHNMELSKARGKSVADYLIGEGIDKSRITWNGYGFTKPLGNDAAQNRRVELRFY